jgi:hypothetical protein
MELEMITFLEGSAQEPEVNTPEKLILYVDATECSTLDDVLLKIMGRLEIENKIKEGFRRVDYSAYRNDLSAWFYANAHREIWWLVDIKKSLLETAGYESIYHFYDIIPESLMLAMSWGHLSGKDFRATKLFIDGPGFGAWFGVIDD